MTYEEYREEALDAYLDTFERTVGSSNKVLKTVSFATAKLVMDAFRTGFHAGATCQIENKNSNTSTPPTQYNGCE